ncbi:FapA family protein [bacterium]|nr:FapA family protein [bacterium]
MSTNSNIFENLEFLLSQKGLLSEEAHHKFLKKNKEVIKTNSTTRTKLLSLEAPSLNEVDIVISPDGYYAYLSIVKAIDHLDVQTVFNNLKLQGITHGVQWDKIKDIVAQFNVDHKAIYSQEIAIGKAVLEPSAPHIKYYFEKLNLMEVDTSAHSFWEQFKLNYVKKNQIIAEKFGSFGGEDGVTVCSQIVRALPKTDITLYAGKNTILKNNQIISLISGRPEVIDNYVHVIDKKTIDQDFDFPQEIIQFDGDIEILGDVRPHNNINVSGNILILGNVINSSLQAEKSILVNGEFSGESQGLIKAKENVYVDQSSSGTIESDENIYILENLIDTNVYALKSLYCFGKNSKVYGGVIQVGVNLVTRNLGTSSDKSTTVFMGNQRFLAKKLEGIRKNSLEKQIQIDTLTESITKIQANFSLDSKNKANIDNLNLLDQLIHGIKSIQKKQIKIMGIEQNLEFQLQKSINHSLKVLDTLHHGVHIQIQKTVKKILQKHKNVEIFYDKESMKILVKNMQLPKKAKKFFSLFKVFK